MVVEVINAGYGRTGTHSFRRAMEILGFGKCYHMEEVFNNGEGNDWIRISEERNPELIRNLFDKSGYRSTCDMPASIYWQEQLKVYPNAKVVITMRDPESWYKSWMSTIAYVQPDAEECTIGVKVAYGLGLPPFSGMSVMMRNVITRDCFHNDWSKQGLMKSYTDHIDDVKKFCHPDKLLLFNAADGWAPLCSFLGVPIPDEPYPHLSDTKEFLKRAMLVNILGWIITILGLGIPLLFRDRGIINDERKKSTNTA